MNKRIHKMKTWASDHAGDIIVVGAYALAFAGVIAIIANEQKAAQKRVEAWHQAQEEDAKFLAETASAGKIALPSAYGGYWIIDPNTKKVEE